MLMTGLKYSYLVIEHCVRVNITAQNGHSYGKAITRQSDRAPVDGRLWPAFSNPPRHSASADHQKRCLFA